MVINTSESSSKSDTIPTGRPYFISQVPNDLDWNEKFNILELVCAESINKLYTASLRTTIPTDFLLDNKSKPQIKTTEDFLMSQMFKHVMIGFIRPTDPAPATDLFSTFHWFSWDFNKGNF